MTTPNRRSVLRTSLAAAAVGTLARPYLANAAAIGIFEAVRQIEKNEPVAHAASLTPVSHSPDPGTRMNTPPAAQTPATPEHDASGPQ